MMLVTTTRPDSAQMTTVSQNVPVDETSAWRTGFRVWAAAATIGAEPRPDSFENRPRATPKRAAPAPAPTKPPAAAGGENALFTISSIAGESRSAVADRIDQQPAM